MNRTLYRCSSFVEVRKFTQLACLYWLYLLLGQQILFTGCFCVETTLHSSASATNDPAMNGVLMFHAPLFFGPLNNAGMDKTTTVIWPTHREERWGDTCKEHICSEEPSV